MKSNTIRTSVLVALAILGLSGCSASYAQSGKASKGSKNEIAYFTDEDGDGKFKRIKLEEPPEPRQGKEQWARDFYNAIKYPVSARLNGTQGIVTLEVLIDETGTVQEVDIKKKVSKDCDEEAKRTFLYTTQQGFTPLIRNGVAVKFKMEMSVFFSLN